MPPRDHSSPLREAMSTPARAPRVRRASAPRAKKPALPKGSTSPKLKPNKGNPEGSLLVPNPSGPVEYADIDPDTGLIKGAPRQTLPLNANVLGMLPYNFLPRRQYSQIDLATLNTASYTPQQLLDLLADAYPEVGLALWNMVRLASSEYTVDVRTPDNTTDDATGKALLDALLYRVNPYWGGFDAVVSQWFTSTILQGACSGETVATPDLRGVSDIVPVQPWSIYFQRDLAQNYVAFQWQPLLASTGGVLLGQQVAGSPPSVGTLLGQNALDHGGFRQLNERTFAYVPLDAEVDDPYGRAPFAPVFQLVAFDAQMLKDLRQWSHVNAWGRIDVSVVYELAEKMMTGATKVDPAKAKAWRRNYLNSIKTAYDSLAPDDTFIHWDNVEVHGVDGSGQTLDIDNLVRVLERRIFRALKQLPILMGSNEGTTETWGTLQMEVYAKGIASVQRTVAALMERLLEAALELMGHAASVKVQFEPLRAVDALSEEEALAQRIKNASAMRDEGWIDQDEASIRVTGSKAVKPGPDPDPLVALAQPDAASGQPTPPPPASGEAGEDANTQGDSEGNPSPTHGKPGSTTATPSEDQPKAHSSSPTPGDATQAKAPASKSGKGSKEEDEEEEPKQGKGSRGASVREERTVDTGAHVRATRARQTAPSQHSGAMVGFFLASEDAEALARALPEGVPNPEPQEEYHVTLTFHGDAGNMSTSERALMYRTVREYARTSKPLSGHVSGVGRFTPEGAGSHPLYASVDVQGLHEWRSGLARALSEVGLTPNGRFEYHPHITLAYLPAEEPTPVHALPRVPLALREVTVALGGERSAYALSGEEWPTPPDDNVPPPSDPDAPISADPEPEPLVDGFGVPLAGTPIEAGRTHHGVVMPATEGALPLVGEPGPEVASVPQGIAYTFTDTRGSEEEEAALDVCALAEALNRLVADVLSTEAPPQSSVPSEDSLTPRPAPTQERALALPAEPEEESAPVLPAPRRIKPYTGPSAARLAHERNLATEVSALLRAQVVSESALRTLLAKHRDATLVTPELALEWPELAGAIAKASAARASSSKHPKPPKQPKRPTQGTGEEGGDSGDGDEEWSEAEEAAMLYVLTNGLTSLIPEEYPELEDVLKTYGLQAWDVAGQEALDTLGLTGAFKLASERLRTQAAAQATQPVSGIQATTRKRLASSLVASLKSGQSTTQAVRAAREAQTTQAATRGEAIATTETARAWNSASATVYRRNGVTHKVWQTGPHPDPKGGAQPCRDNSYAGAIPMDATFPSGNSEPPAHPNCICVLQPASDPSEQATLTPWTGD